MRAHTHCVTDLGYFQFVYNTNNTILPTCRKGEQRHSQKTPPLQLFTSPKINFSYDLSPSVIANFTNLCNYRIKQKGNPIFNTIKGGIQLHLFHRLANEIFS